MRLKVCKACGSKFTPARPMQVACDWQCAIEYSRKLKDKREAKAHREAKVKAKSRQQWMNEAQAAFNKFIRIRDAELPCVSCGRFHNGQYHAGHYRTTKAAPELRFCESNVHKQCSVCNNHLSGNIVDYRRGLQFRIGTETLEWLEGKHEAKHYTIDDLKAIKSKYSLMAKELQSANTDMV